VRRHADPRRGLRNGTLSPFVRARYGTRHRTGHLGVYESTHAPMIVALVPPAGGGSHSQEKKCNCSGASRLFEGSRRVFVSAVSRFNVPPRQPAEEPTTRGGPDASLPSADVRSGYVVTEPGSVRVGPGGRNQQLSGIEPDLRPSG